MAKKTDKTKSMSKLLLEELKACESYSGVEKATGVMRQTMSRFVRGMTSLRLDKADLLARHFGIECERRKGR